MRAVGVIRFGGPEALQVVDVPDQPLGPGQVRLRVAAATVNPTDTHLRSGAYADRDPVKQPPWVPGMDVAGDVAEVGEGVTHLAPGDPAMGVVVPSGAHGGYRENLVLPGDSVVRAPAGADAVAASTLPMNALTARYALDQMALRPGQVVAVTGAAGVFGGYVVQLAKADGLTVGADAPEADGQLVRAPGAAVVVRREPVGHSCGAWALPGSAGAAATWPRGSARSSRRGSTGWPTARCRTRSCCPPSGTAALSRPCGVTAETGNGTCGCSRLWCAGSLRTGRRWTGCAGRPRTAC